MDIQDVLVINHLRQYGSITQRIADDEYGITRLPAVIYRLRKKGYRFDKKTETGKNRFGVPTHWARYYLPRSDR